MDLSFYQGKKVLVTGHTGFKGAWLVKMLLMAGAEVTGFSLEPDTEPNLFSEILTELPELQDGEGKVPDPTKLDALLPWADPLPDICYKQRRD